MAARASGEGNFQAAAKIYKKIIEKKPNHYFAKKNLAELQNRESNIPCPAKPHSPPTDKQIKTLTGLVESGQLTKAKEYCQKLLVKSPEADSLFTILGCVLAIEGKVEEAIARYNTAISLNKDSAGAYFNRANSLATQKQFEEAINDYHKAVSLNPEYMLAHLNLGSVLDILGRLNEARESYSKAIDLDPLLAVAYHNRGNVLTKLGRLTEASTDYDTALKLNPDFVEAHSARGALLFYTGQPEAALLNYDKAIQLNPQYYPAYYNKGRTLRALGSFNEAIKSYEKSIEIKPNYAPPIRELTHLKKLSTDNFYVNLMKKFIRDPATSDVDRMHFYFALAKVYDDAGHYDLSFSHLKQANSYRENELNYDFSNYTKLFKRVRQIYKNVSLSTTVDQENPSSLRPIFIIGMPRSGTSLTEQILASHTKVFGAGELTFIRDLAFDFVAKQTNKGASTKNPSLSVDNILHLRNGYLKRLAGLNVKESIITDKMPTNFMYVGLILSAFPEAKLIHTKRHPIATCWSIYKHFFAKDGNAYAYNLKKLGEYYNLYNELMSFWHNKFPGQIYDLCYEDLTMNQELESRELLDVCELEWEDQCLNFHKTKRAVNTASAAQVRQKMYQGSSEAWRNYERHLGPLIERLQIHNSIGR